MQLYYLTAKIFNLALNPDHEKMLMLPIVSAERVLQTAGCFSM